MTRKHFVAIAKAFAENKPAPYQIGAYDQWQIDVMAMATICASANSNFSRSRFYAACGMEN